MTQSIARLKKTPRAVLFDLDGTLLQVEMNHFIPAYVEGLSRHFSDLASRRRFVDGVVRATFALLHDDSDEQTNQELFLRLVEDQLAISPDIFLSRFAAYAEDGMHGLQSLVKSLDLSREILAHCFAQGWSVIVATNPVFPRELVEARLRWSGLDDFSYHLVTSSENTRFCKPHPRYFLDILETFDLQPSDCLMVGNDTEHDLAAAQVGIATYLVDTWLVDRLGSGYHYDFRGDHADLLRFLKEC